MNKRLGQVDGLELDLVDELAARVDPLARPAFGVPVPQVGGEDLPDRAGGDVLACDQRKALGEPSFVLFHQRNQLALSIVHDSRRTAISNYCFCAIVRLKAVAQHILKGRPRRQEESKMSSKNKQLPASSAGLLRFFEDETEGVKIKPEIVLIASMGLVRHLHRHKPDIPGSGVVDRHRGSELSSLYYSGRFICMVPQLNS